MDGCGTVCGICEEGDVCSDDGICECIPDCVGKLCGLDGCGDFCGVCGENEVCSADG